MRGGRRGKKWIWEELQRKGECHFIPPLVHYSPIMSSKRGRAETVNGVIRPRHELSSQSSSTSLLEVPHAHMPHPHMPRMYHSTSSSPSSSPPTSPSLTPSSPRSPNEYIPGGYSRYQYPRRYLARQVYVKQGDDSDGYESESSPYSSEYSSTNDVSDQSRVMADTPQGQRPGPQIILAKSLPDLLSISTSPTESDLDKSCTKFLEQPRERREEEEGEDGMASLRPTGGRRVSMDSHSYHHGKVRRKESLQRTLSTADSKASTLVASVPVSEVSNTVFVNVMTLYQVTAHCLCGSLPNVIPYQM